MSASLLAVVRKAMALAAAARYPRVEDLQADVLAYQNGFATSAEQAGAWKQFTLFVRRHKAASIGAAAVLLVGTVLGTKAVIEGRRANRTLTRLRGTAPTFVAQAGALIDDGRFDEALGKLAFATDLAPGLTRAHLLRGHVLQTQLHFTEALASLQTALSLARDPAEVADARANLALCEKIQAENSGQSEVLPKSLAELTEAISRQGRTAEALSLAPRAGLAEKFRYETMFAKLKSLLRIPNTESDKFRKRLWLEPSGLFSFDLSNLPIADLAPLQGLPIHSLNLEHCSNIADLSPLKDLRLENLNISTTQVSDLSPLREMKLKTLKAMGCKITDLSPLAGMPLTQLEVHRLNSAGISDLTPLSGMPLKLLFLDACGPVSDLRPLKGMPLEGLWLNAVYPITDLRPLAGMRLRTLQFTHTGVQDVSPLLEMPVLERVLVTQHVKNIEVLRHHPTIQQLGWENDQSGSNPSDTLPVAKFWQRYDALKAAGAGK